MVDSFSGFGVDEIDSGGGGDEVGGGGDVVSDFCEDYVCGGWIIFVCFFSCVCLLDICF